MKKSIYSLFFWSALTASGRLYVIFPFSSKKSSFGVLLNLMLLILKVNNLNQQAEIVVKTKNALLVSSL